MLGQLEGSYFQGCPKHLKMQSGRSWLRLTQPRLSTPHVEVWRAVFLLGWTRREFYACPSHHFLPNRDLLELVFSLHLSQVNLWRQFLAASFLPALTSPSFSSLGVTNKPNRPAGSTWTDTKGAPHFSHQVGLDEASVSGDNYPPGCVTSQAHPSGHTWPGQPRLHLPPAQKKPVGAVDLKSPCPPPASICILSDPWSSIA